MSTLVLSMVDAPAGMQHETRHIAAGRFTVGRDRENDWVLPDPGRRLSRRHCVFQHDHTGWTVIDLSRNGIVHAQERAGRGIGASNDVGRSGMLQTGDVLHLGDYALSVTLQDDDSSFQLRPLPEFLDHLRQSLSGRMPDAPVQDEDATMIAAVPTAPFVVPASPRDSADVSADPLFQLLGLDEQALSPDRRSVVLYRIASALDAMMRGMRQFPELHEGGGEETPFSADWSREEMLRWIAGLSTVSPITPELAIDAMFAHLRLHQDTIHAAHRETTRVLLDFVNPDETHGQGVRRPVSLGTVRRRHGRLRAQLDVVLDKIYRRAYAAIRPPRSPTMRAAEDGEDACGSAS